MHLSSSGADKMDPTNALFEESLSKFKSRLTAKEREDFEFTTLDDVRTTLLRIQTEQELRQSVVNFTRIQSFLEAMEQFSNVIQTAHTWTDSFEALLNAYEQIGKHIPLLEQYKTVFEYSPHMRQVLAYIYMDILEFHRRAIRFFSGHAWHQIFRSAWKDFDTRFGSILEKLQHHKTLIQEQAGILHFQESQSKSQEVLRQIEEFRRAQSASVEKIEGQIHQQNLRNMLEWFSAAHSVSDQELFCDVRCRYPGSGEWILEQEWVANWLDSDVPINPILWVNGIPGAGKTILTSLIVDKCLSQDKITTAYFYCRDEDPKKNTCISIYRGILTQLLPRYPTMAQYCSDKSSTSGELILTSIKLAQNILELLCKLLPKTYLIIDGLDECAINERKALLSSLLAIVEKCEASEPGKVRILIVSQDFADIRKELQDSSFSNFSIGLENRDDIQMFVSQEASKLKSRFDVDDHQVTNIQALTCARAKGMFLFASLVMENLSKQLTKQDLLREVTESRFPNGLGQAYQRIMDRMQRNLAENEWHIAQKLLGWMVCAKRTLRWREIQGALSIDAIEQTIAFDEKKLRVHIQELCGSLVQILPGDRVELVHNTAKHYIGETDYVDKSAVERELTTLCLQYLVFPFFREGTTESELHSSALNGHFVFQDYAVSMWFRHLGSYITSGRPISAESMGSGKDANNLQTALDDFIMIHPDLGSNDTLLPKSYTDCEPFCGHSFYSHLLPVWNHILQHQEKGHKFRNDISLPSLARSLERNRDLIEKLFPKHDSISQHYGDRPFKCSKITCFYFHEGFKEAKVRKKHINRHDRPFYCTVLDCTSADFGFTNGKDLEKHIRFYHPDESDLSEFFIVQSKAPTEGLRHQCPLCPRQFTRKINLEAHISNHSGSRPFACPECGKAFTRKSDCIRHKKLHDKRK